MTKQEVFERLKAQLALEFHCGIEDFSRPDNVVSQAADIKGRRQYIKGIHFFSMVTLGQNAVISADERVIPWLRDYVKDRTGHWLFEHNHLRAIENELSRYGRHIRSTHHMYLPDMNILPVRELAPVRWHEQEELTGFYKDEKFPNALCERFLPERPDMLAVTAWEGSRIVGMAGCSADTPDMWQLGIDVQEDCRGRGLGTYLVTLLKNEVIRRGKLPFYGTSLSNLHSIRIALRSGFFPAWIETETDEE